MYSFLEATIVQQTTPADAYAKFEEMSGEIADRLKHLTKVRIRVQKTQHKHDGHPVLQWIGKRLT